MKKPLLTALILALGASVAQANDMQRVDKKDMLVMAESKQESVAPNSKAAVDPAVDSMRKMQMQMDAIRQTQDPAKRQAMMQDHMRMMKDGMLMMRNMLNGSTMQKPMRGSETARMDMMQQMMDQMMQHMEAM